MLIGSHKRLQVENPLKIERACSFFKRNALHGVGVNHGGSHVTVPQEFLNRANVIFVLEQMTGKAMPKRMGACALAYPGGGHRLFDRLVP